MLNRASLNHIYRTVWNQSLGAMVAVAEISTGQGCSSGAASRNRSRLESGRPPTLAHLGILSLGIAMAWGALPSAAVANPVGGVAVHGQAGFNTGVPNKLLVTTQNGVGTNHSAINWQSFSLPAGNTTYFQQPNAGSTVINRVVTNTPSLIFGALGSNGNLVLVNQSGIAVGAGAVVDTAGFTASALGMSDADALLGRLRFGSAEAGATGVSVHGQIMARSGDLVLIAPKVDVGPDALIRAPNGSAILAAGQQVEITGRGLEGIRLQVQAPTDAAVNLGSLQGNAVGMFASTLRHSGSIQATAVSVEGGKVVLKALDPLDVDGRVRAQGPGGQGGVVHATGGKVTLSSGADIDVSGVSGGGEALIGGGWQGHDPRISNAQQTVVATGARINADATERGNGGTAVVWADGFTGFGGSVSARGGALGGDGGQAEVSGKQYLDFRGVVDLTAPLGRTGSLLLDPASITIGTVAEVDGSGYGGDVSGNIASGDYFGVNSQITAAQVATLLNSASLSLAATGNIDVTAAIAKTGSPATTLTLQSDSGNISVNAPISTSDGALGVTLTATSGNVAVTQAITTRGGDVTMGAGGALGISTVGLVTKGVDSTGSSNGTAGGAVNLNASVGNVVVGGIDSHGGFGGNSSFGGFSGGNGGNVSLVRGSGDLTLSGLSIDTSGGAGGNATQAGYGGGVGGYGGNITLQPTAGKLTLGGAAGSLISSGANGGDAFLFGTSATTFGGSAGGAGTINLGGSTRSGGTNALEFSGNLNLNSAPGFAGKDNTGVQGVSGVSNSVQMTAGTGGISQTGGAITGGANIDINSVGSVSVTGVSNAFNHATGSATAGAISMAGVTGVGTSPLTALDAVDLSGAGNIDLLGNITSTNGSVSVSSTGGSLSSTQGNSVTAAGLITLKAKSDVTLKGAILTSSSTGDAVVLKADGALTVTLGLSGYGGSVSTPNGRALAYVNYGPTHNFALLAPSFKQYNYTTGATILGTGNGVIYSNATPAVLTSTLGGAASKIYDAGLDISLSGVTFGSLSGAIDGDILTGASLTGGTGSLSDKNVGTAKLVTVSGMTLSGVTGGNGIPLVYGYLLSASGIVGNVTPKTLTESGLTVPSSKVYDATTAAVVSGTAALATESVGTGSTADGKAYSGDAVSLTGTALGTYNSKDVATATTVSFSGLTLTGTQAGNYTLSMQAPAPATITPKSLSESGLSVPSSKVYDATTAAVVSGSAALATEAVGTGSTSDGKAYSGDTVSLIGTAVGTYNSKDVATAANVSFSGLTLTGTQAGNYTLSMQAPATATITPKALNESGLTVPLSKVYDATTAAVVSGSAALATEAVGAGSNSDGKAYSGDVVSLTGTAVGTYNSKDVATATTVSFSGLALTGAQTGNYSLIMQAPAPAAITPKALSASVSAPSKVYDGNTTATPTLSVTGGLVGSEVVTAAGTASFNSKDVLTANLVTVNSTTLVSGSGLASNYSLAAGQTTTASITPKGLSASVSAPSKV
ncbi:MAG: YDG domain-containing protein, partial [Polaromonas sp.]|nr:YDG domain-containing protein [Polaromonas sp.]